MVREASFRAMSILPRDACDMPGKFSELLFNLLRFGHHSTCQQGIGTFRKPEEGCKVLPIVCRVNKCEMDIPRRLGQQEA